jgi:hypothetical protein
MSEDEIVDALLGFQEMRVKETRTLLLSDLSFISDIPDIGATPRDHVRNLVRACAARQGGFRQLLRALDHLSDTDAYKTLVGLVRPVDVSVDLSMLRALTHLCDRSDHHNVMSEALKEAKGRFDRPLVFLYNGAIDQGYDAFIDVVKQKTIYVGSSLNSDYYKVNYWPMTIPGKYENETTFAKNLRRNLATCMEVDPETSIKEINETMIFEVPGPALVTAFVLASYWRRDGLKRIMGFLKFWDEWPPLTPNYPLVVCIGVRFEVSHRLRLPLALLSRWSQLNRIKSRVASIDLAGHKKVLGKRLPPFLGVEWEAAQTWTTRLEVRKIRDGLDEPLQELYKRPGLARFEPEDTEWIPRIPMNKMIEELSRLLDP